MLRRHLVQFWTLVAIFAVALAGSPRPAAASGSVTLNDGMGTSREEPPRFVIYPSTFAMVYDGKLAVGGTEAAPHAGWLYYAGGTLYGAPELTALSGASTTANWTSSAVTETAPDQAQQVFVGGSTTFTITWSTSNGPIAAMVDSIEFSPKPTSGTHALYFVADTKLLGRTDNDYVGGSFGPGEIDPWDNYVTVPEDDWLNIAGITLVQTSVVGGKPESTMYGSVTCVFGAASGCPSEGPSNGSSYSGDQSTAADGAMGVYYDLTANVEARSGFGIVAFGLPVEGSTTDAAEQCDQLPDLAVSPERIELTAGGTAQIEVAMRNLCADQPYSNADLLLSLDEQLQVTGVPAGWVNLGNRAAWQNLSLRPGETYRAVITISAPNGVPAGPSHTWELYAQGRAQKRIDGVFITPAPAAPSAAAPAAPSAAAPAAPAPLPAVLPNTGGPLLPLGALGLAALGLAALGAIRRRLR